MAKTLRIGMIGYRFMGKAHSNAWRQAPHFFPLKAGVELHTICGRDPKALESAREQLGWSNASTDWEEVINNPEIDAVDINTPNDSHAEIAITQRQPSALRSCRQNRPRSFLASNGACTLASLSK